MPAGSTSPLTSVDPNAPVGVSLRSEKPASVTCSPHDEVHSPPTTFCVSDSLENSIRKMMLEDETPMLPTPLSSILVANPARHDGATRFLPITDRGYQTLHNSVPCCNTTSTRTTGAGSPLYTNRCNVSFPTAELSFCTDGRTTCGESGSFFCGAGLSVSEQLAGRTASLASEMDTDALLVLQDDMTDGSVSLPLAVPLLSSEKINLSDPVDAAIVSPTLQTHVVDHAVTAEQGTRRTMEDCHTTFVTCSDNIAFFGVYDGHGGSQCAEYLRDELHRLVLSHEKIRTDPEVAVQEALLEADHSFLAAGEEGGAVCAVAVIIDDILVVANVGDVEVILSRRESIGTVVKDGKESGSSQQLSGPPRVLTVVHQPQRNGREGERVLEAGGKLTRVQRVGHPNNLLLSSLAVSRAIGDAGFKLPEYTDGKPSGIIADPHTCSLRLQSDRDEFLVMACDGLWDVMPYEEVQQLCRSAVAASGYTTRAGDLTQMLVEEALMRGTTDNITVAVVGLGAFRTPPPPLPQRQTL